MSTITKSPIAVARRALTVAAKALRPFAHRFSPQRYSQPQLFACLTLKAFFKTDYRGIVVLLRDLSDLRQVLGLRCVPHFTTLHKAGKRLLGRRRGRRLLRGTLRRFQGRRTRVRRAAFDSTGLDCGHASRYFIRRRGRGAAGAQTVRYTRGGGRPPFSQPMPGCLVAGADLQPHAGTLQLKLFYRAGQTP